MSGDRQVKILFDEAALANRTEALAREISAAKPKDLLVVAILKGSFMFAADLLRALHRVGLEPQVEFFHLSSYLEATVSSGAVKILRRPSDGWEWGTKPGETLSNWMLPLGKGGAK